LTNSARLPDFCHPEAVLIMVMLGLLLALILTLSGLAEFGNFWPALAVTGLMVETIVLGSCLLLCIARRLLEGMPHALGLLLIFIVIQALCLLVSWIAFDWFIAPGLADQSAQRGFWLLRNTLVSAIASVVFVRYLVLHRQWQLQVRAEAESRLGALQARIRPHFLFNTLNTIASLVRRRPDDAEQAVVDLSDLLRTGLKGSARHTLADELELIRGYLRIEAQRLGERLRIDWALSDDLPLEQNIPALLIQPLVENAVVHGVARLPDGGVIRIESESRPGGWMLRITNPVPDEGERRRFERGNDMALANIRQRLELAYGRQARLKAGLRDGRFIAELLLKHTS